MVCPVNLEAQSVIELALPSDDDMEAWVKNIYKSRNNAGLHQATINAYAKQLWQAVKENYNGFNADWDAEDADMISHLADNVYHFATAKNHAELKSLTQAIVSDEGKIRSFAEFRKEASNIMGTFRGTWLEAEYELAVSGSQMASKWVEFEKTGDETLLQYITAKDARVSDICGPLDNVVKKKTDSFWNTYYPPNHFRCRCNALRINSGKETADTQIELPVVPAMLQTNLGKDKLIFPKAHPYFIGAPNNVKKAGKQLLPKNNGK